MLYGHLNGLLDEEAEGDGKRSAFVSLLPFFLADSPRQLLVFGEWRIYFDLQRVILC